MLSHICITIRLEGFSCCGFLLPLTDVQGGLLACVCCFIREFTWPMLDLGLHAGLKSIFLKRSILASARYRGLLYILISQIAMSWNSQIV